MWRAVTPARLIVPLCGPCACVCDAPAFRTNSPAAKHMHELTTVAAPPNQPMSVGTGHAFTLATSPTRGLRAASLARSLPRKAA